MEQERPVEIGAQPESRVRALGFDPSHLTREEQTELLELHAVSADESRETGVEEGEVW